MTEMYILNTFHFPFFKNKKDDMFLLFGKLKKNVTIVDCKMVGEGDMCNGDMGREIKFINCFKVFWGIII